MTKIDNVNGINNIINEGIKKKSKTSSSSDEYKKIFDKKVSELSNSKTEKLNLSKLDFNASIQKTDNANNEKFIDAVKNTSDIRQDKVDFYKDLIESGNYNVSGRDIAEKMLKSGIFKDLQ